jgi:integrase
MSITKARPWRRRSVPGKQNVGIYERYDGRYEVGFKDSAGTQRWRVPGCPSAFDTITEARRARATVVGIKAAGGRVKPSPRLTFGEAADRWLAEQVAELRAATQAKYRNSIDLHLRPRWGRRRLDDITVDDAARLVRELRAEGKAESTIAAVLGPANRVFKFARRRCHWHGENPIGLLENSERPRLSEKAEPRIYEPDELIQLLAATTGQWTTLFRLASVIGARESELLGLCWEDLELRELDAATVRITHQATRAGARVELKTDESRAVLPLPRSTALLLLEHEAASTHTGPRAFVFASRTGRPLGQRNVLRALYRAQEQARTPLGRPTFPELFEHDAHGELGVDANGEFIPQRVPRRKLRLPHFHSLRHTAAMDCGDAEEAADLLRHKNSTVTRQVYRSHFNDQRRQRLRDRMEARMAETERSMRPPTAAASEADAVPLRAAG